MTPTRETWKRRDRRELANGIYAILEPVLNKYEIMGWNSHSRAQVLIDRMLSDTDTWIYSILETIEQNKDENS